MNASILSALMTFLYAAPTLEADFEAIVKDIQSKADGKKILADILATTNAVGAAVSKVL